MIDGKPGDMTRAAIRSFQARTGRPVNGQISLAQFDTLLGQAKNRKASVGYRIAFVPESGLTLGLPTALATVRRKATWGPLWENKESSAVFGALHIDDGRTLYEIREKLRHAYPGRRIAYEAEGADWFVLVGADVSGHTFYVKLQGQPGSLKGFSATIQNSVKPVYWPIVMAMASDYRASAPEPVPAQPKPAPAPAPTPHRTSPTDNRAPDCDDPKYRIMCIEAASS